MGVRGMFIRFASPASVWEPALTADISPDVNIVTIAASSAQMFYLEESFGVRGG